MGKRGRLLRTEGSADVVLISSVSWAMSFSRESLSRWAGGMCVKKEMIIRMVRTDRTCDPTNVSSESTPPSLSGCPGPCQSVDAGNQSKAVGRLAYLFLHDFYG